MRGIRRTHGDCGRASRGASDLADATWRRRSVEDFQPRARQLTPSAVGRHVVPEEGLLSQFKRFVVGKPIPSHLAQHERLSRVTGLAVLSSDALSSVAYATEEILRMLGNLRGIRESGRIFAVPTYFFIVTILMLIAIGTWHVLFSTVHPVVPVDAVPSTHDTLSLFLLLTAFSNGCTAMTGVEAVSNGVPAFKPPESKNAAATMLMMAALSITMFLGITLLAQSYHIMPSDTETVVSQLARGVFG